MGVFGRIMAAVSSTWGAAFRLGRLDRTTANNLPGDFSGDAAAISVADLLGRRSRDMARNNGHARKVCDAWQDLLVGCGLQTLADPFDAWDDLQNMTDDELDRRLRYALESDELYAEWWNDRDAISVDGRFTGPELQRLAVSEVVQRGQAFLVESWNRRPGAVVPLQYQLLEAEQLDRSISQPGAVEGSRIIEGIEVDRTGREIAYYLYQWDHPGDAWAGFGASIGKSVRVPAERCTHLHLALRPSAHHGTSWYHPAGQTEIDRDGFLTTELATARKAAALALVVQKKNPTKGGMGFGTGATEAGDPEIRLSTSPMAVQIGTDEKVAMVESTRPTAQAEPFLRVLDRYAAAGYGLGYSTLTGDYSQGAYSALQLARQDEDAHVKPLQAWLGSSLALPMRRRWSTVYAATVGFDTVSATEFAANRRRYLRADALGPGREFLNPLDETDAAVARLRSGLSTLKIECAKRGLHWVKILRQARLENRVANVLQLALDFSKGQGGQVSGNTRQAGANQTQATGA